MSLETDHITLRYHHALDLNAISLLTDPDLGQMVLSSLKRTTPLTQEGIDFFMAITSMYEDWGEIVVTWVVGPDDVCTKCNGWDTKTNKCTHRHYFDDRHEDPDDARIIVDERVKQQTNGTDISTLKKAHQWAVKQGK
jgi:hypothetical protein